MNSKECIHCGIVQPLSEFRYRKRRNTPEYYYVGFCKTCERSMEQKRWYANHEENKQKLRHKIRHLTYGITKQMFESLLEKQNHKCAICKAQSPGGRGDWHVDHCHTTGKIRGLLCHHCNTGLGLFMDDITTLQQAIKYLYDSK